VLPWSCCAGQRREPSDAPAARLALSQQAETVQRVERSLREQEQALSKAVGERLDRTEKATGQIVTDLRERLVAYRRGAEEDRRSLDPGR
jgi:hypothetical protein